MTRTINQAHVSAPEAEEQVVLGSSTFSGDRLPSKVLIAPWGEVKSTNGTFVVDEEAAQLVVEVFKAQGTDLPIDYEHQSLGGIYASPSGQAPAAGWIRSLQIVKPSGESDQDAGLLADVEWTESAQAKLSAKEYRYLSPVVIVRKRDRRVVALHSAALTNKPAIAGMKPIVNRETPESSTEGALELLRMRLGLPVDNEVETILLAAEDRLASLMREVEEREAREKILEAMRAGKLTPAQREWAMALALKDPVGFDEWLATAPTVVTLGRTSTPVKDGHDRDRAAVISSARLEFRSEPKLTLLTNESSWIQEALRERGFESSTEINVLN